MLSKMLGSTLLSAIALLASQVDAQRTAHTQEVCRTFYGTRSAPVGTTTSASTVFYTPTVMMTSTPSVAVNAPVVTTTKTITYVSTTSLSLVTDTYTTTAVSTETDSTTITSTIGVTATTTSTVTVGNGISTVAIPNGFIYPTATPGGLKARDAEPAVKRGGAVLPRAVPNSPHRHGNVQRYPSRVQCNVVVQTIIPTTAVQFARTTRTVTNPVQTRTATLSQTVTSTIVYPDASTTVTVFAAATTTATYTSTEIDSYTTTVTAVYSQPATSTYYPVCDSAQNEVSTGPNGGPLIYNGGFTGQAGLISTDTQTDSAYNCCALCFSTLGCLGSNFGTGYSPTCELETSGDATCPANQGGNAGTYSEGIAGVDVPLTFSNGPCGTFLFQ